MKVLVGEFVTESNANIPTICTIKQYDIGLGEDCIQKMGIREVFERNDVTLIPSIYANAGAAGVVEKSAFTYIEHVFIDTLKKNLHEIDGIFLMLHGASEVEALGSGDHHILKELRKLAGPYLPIAIVCDPHGNLCKEYAESATILRSYRESPHTDADETMEKVAEMLCGLLKKRRNIHAVYRKLPLILGGEQSVSADEPVLSINRYMDELEKDDRILSCSWHVGYIRHDCDVAGCGIIVVPYSEQDLPYAQEAADRLAAYVWEKRHEFHYTGLTASPSKALQMALDVQDKPVFLTDSGDNVTSGAMGANTFILRQVLACEHLTKRFLFAAINDPAAYQLLEAHDVQEQVHLRLGMNMDECTAAVELDVTILAKGRQEGTHMYGEEGDYGGLVSVSVKDKPITIVVTDNNHSFVEKHQMDACGIDWDDYDVIVVKQGYIHPEMKEKGKLCIMSLTDGATLQDTKRIPFKLIMRPMYPLDDM